jgi:thymidylate synthase
MRYNYVFQDVNEALPFLLKDLARGGEEVGSRAGRTLELTHVGVTLEDPRQREILVPHRKASIAAQIAETAWVLAGRSDVDWLCHYLPRASEFSDDGKVWRAGYGQRLRSWPRRDGDPSDVVDQLRWVVDHLRESPSSRQAVMSIWDPVVDTTLGKDIPCNDWLNFSSRLGRLDLHVAVRSNDIIWGWSGINQFEWSVLLEVVAGLLGLQVGSLHFSTTSLHIYDRHWLKSRRIRDAYSSMSTPRPLPESPRFNALQGLRSRDVDGLDDMLSQWFEIEKGIRLGHDMDAFVDAFPEPMFQSWLRVLQWWWTSDRDYLEPLVGTALEDATYVSVQPPEREKLVVQDGTGRDIRRDFVLKYEPSKFMEQICKLHVDKDAAYGGSWKRRGEMLGIMANIARKIDRLGGAETADETSVDTAGDLFVYLAKYLTWLEDERDDSDLSDDPECANAVMREVETANSRVLSLSDDGIRRAEEYLKTAFDQLEDAVVRKDPRRHEIVDNMLSESYLLARQLFDRAYNKARRNASVRDNALMGTNVMSASDEDEYRGADVD